MEVLGFAFCFVLFVWLFVCGGVAFFFFLDHSLREQSVTWSMRQSVMWYWLPGNAVLSSLSMFYLLQDLSPWDGTAPIEGGSFQLN